MNWLALASIVSAALAVSFGAIGPALAEGRAVAAAMDALARQPEAANTVSRTLFVGLAMIETMAIYCLVIALLLLFANPCSGTEMTIDWWTLGLQAINVLILVWLLARFFWAPVATMIAERRDSIAQSLAAAEAGRAAAAAQLAAIEETRAGFTTEREAVLATARADADKDAASRLAKARQDAEDLRQEAQASLLRERQAAERQWQEQAGMLAVDIAGKLVARLDDTALRRAFFNDLLHGIAALPDIQRHGLTAADASLDLTSAWSLAPAEMAEFGNALVASLGCPRPRLSTDPALIAGFELRSPHVVVGNSWKADLDRIGQDLRHAS